MTGSRPNATATAVAAAPGVDRSGGRWWHLPQGLVTLVVIAGIIRVVGLLSPGHGGDLFAFQTWAEDAVRSGLGTYYSHGGDSNYPPMLYLLWLLGSTLQSDALIGAIRLLSIPFDLALGLLLFVVVRRETGSEGDGLLGAAFYLLNPAVILVGPMWGQVDGMGALPMVGAIVAAARGRLGLAGALAVLAGLLKPQFGIAAIVLAGLALFWLRSPDGFRRVLVLAFSALLTFAVVLLPLGMGPFGYLDLLGDTFSRYPYISEFGFNPWGMVFGFGDDDAAWFRIGTGLAIAGIAASLWLLRRRRDLVGLLGVSVLIGLALYFVPTRVHERYLFGAIAFLAPLAVLEPTIRRPFFALSLAFFGTLAYVLMTSPYRILPGPKFAEFDDWAISFVCLVVTAIGAWTAARVVGLFGGRPIEASALVLDSDAA